MKLRTIFTMVCGLIMLQSCVAQNLSQSIENAIGEKLYARFSGRCFVKATNENSYLIFFNTNKSSDSYDKAIVVFSTAGLNKPNFDEQTTVEIFIPDNKRYMVLYNQNTDKIFIAGLTDQAAKQAIEKFKSNAILKTAFANTDALGYGLSYMSGLWNMVRVKESKYKLPFNTLDYSDSQNTQLRASLSSVEEESLDGPGGGGVSCAQGTCTSGGAGSSSCSITEAPLGQSCTVTCNAGYYACCVSSSVRCYCCKN